ncbi:LysR family transcriptional regulator [Rouxiella badensis]|jgi:DNA-binding transcriptional LysR family regulator|uniref:LysR family transcriptional regulator n=1 Tax=Rouxiella badensis TaxID=1646377 RepID=UPI00037DA78D|nr:LysR family transcriptional regulator [Rouxiella badensis]MCC3701711.1 LysR family transcriptional regulator [Rouxiella badensis]MCC3720101.1 LysR family transcriptional regulator [Rouxiella badensis]MCC3729764.1 LysR family transcriptional regulator [Rouxiella badensis]MCC3738288.1 LysR family transcriptional regulator [Rouxiella badensis]MCC3748760.1 LysR family transcriptional regulator [Rouxiella badensis]
MDLRKLKSFTVLAETLHFARAAAEVNLTQPALSNHIKALEKDLGIRLFERNQRSVSLTMEGKVLLGDVQHAVNQLELLEKTAKRLAAGYKGVLRLGYVGTSVLDPTVMNIIREFRRRCADIDIIPVESDVNRQLLLLQQGQLDLALVRKPLPVFRDLALLDLVKNKLYVVLPAHHPLASKKRISVEDLANEPLILQDDPMGVGLGGAVYNIFQRKGLLPHNTHLTKEVNVAIALVAMGMGIAVVPDSQRSLLIQDVVYREIDDAQAVTQLSLCWHKKIKNQSVKLFVKHVEAGLGAE